MRKNNVKRTVAMMLTVFVLLGTFPMSVFAAHTHTWSYAPATGTTIQASCDNADGACTSPTATITIAPPAQTAYDGSPKAVTVSGLLDGMATPTIQYTDMANNASLGATAPAAPGSYSATVLMNSGATFAMATCAYTITPNVITSVSFDVTAPVAGEVPQSTVAAGTGYAGSVSWRPAVSTFGHSTEYIADVTLTAQAGYIFSDAITAPTGWNMTFNSSVLTFTRKFPATESAKITSVAAPTYAAQFTESYADAAAAIKMLPQTTTGVVGGNTVQLAIQWLCVYDPTAGKYNDFIWSVSDSISAQFYDVAAGVTTSGSLRIKNIDPAMSLSGGVTNSVVKLEFGKTWAEANAEATASINVKCKLDSTNVSGTWQFLGQALDAYPTAPGTYPALFTPDDTRTYEVLLTELTISFIKADPAIDVKTYDALKQEATSFYPGETVSFVVDAYHPDHTTWKVPANLISVSAAIVGGATVPVLNGGLVIPDAAEGKDIVLTITIADNQQYIVREVQKIITVKNRNVVNNTAIDQTVDYKAGLSYDVRTLFTLDPNAGTASYSLISGGDIATLNGVMLSITGTGEIKVQLHTAVNGLYAADTDVAVLTVSKIAGQAYVSLRSWNYGQMANTPLVSSTTHSDVLNAATYHYKGVDNNGIPYDSTSAPIRAGQYKLTVTLPANRLYLACEASVDFTVNKINPTLGVVSVAAGALYTSTLPKDVALSITGGTPGKVKLADSVTALMAGTRSYPVVFTPADNCNYTEGAATITLTVVSDTLLEIVASGSPTKTVYVHGDTFDPAGLTLTAKYQSGRNVTLALDDTAISYPTLTAGDTSATISYSGKSLTVTGIVVNKAELTISGVTAADAVYNKQGQAGFTGTPTSDYSGTYVYTYRAVGLADSSDRPVNVGSYTLIISIPADHAYYTGSVSLDFEITRASVTVYAEDKYVTVGTTLPTLTYRTSGLCAGDTLGFEPTLSCAADVNVEADYTITVSGQSTTANYTIAYQNGTMYVSRASGSGSVTMDDWTYGQTASTPYVYSTTNDTAGVSFYYTGTTNGGQSYASYSCPTEAGSYTVTATFPANATYTSFEASDAFTILRATPSYTAPAGFTARFGDSLASLALPSGFNWQVSGATVGDAGTNTHYVTYTPADPDNYQTVTDIAVSVVVSKLDISSLVPQISSGYVYNGSQQSCTITLPTINGQTVTYTVSGNTATDVGTYTVTITGTGNFEGELSGSWSILALSMSDSSVVVSLGQALIYNGQEQTQSISSVRVGNHDISYSVAGNIGTDVDVYYMTIYSQETKNVTGSVQVKWTIAPDTSKIDGLTVDNVTSADEPAIREVLDSIQTPAAKSEWAGVIDHCEKLLDAIKNAANSLSDILDALDAYDINTVKSTDQARIERLEKEIDNLLEQGNLTDEEREALSAGADKADALLDRIADVAATIKDITDRLAKYDIETVKSTDKADIEDILADVNALLEGDNLTAIERSKMKQAKSKAESLLGRIQTAYDQTHTDKVLAAEKLTKSNVKVSDRATIEGAIADLEKAIAKYPGNYTDAERTKIDTELARLRELLAWVTDRAAIEDALNKLLPSLDGYDINTVKSTDRAAIESIDAQISALLNEDALSASEKLALQAGADKADALLDRIADVAATIKDITDRLAKYDIETVKSTDKADIEAILADINALLDGDNLTLSERAKVETYRVKAEALLRQIQNAYDQAHTEDVLAAEKLTKDNAKVSDRATIEGAIKDLELAIANYPGNYTDTERKAIDDELARLRELLAHVVVMEGRSDLLSALDRYHIDTVKSSDQADIEDIKAELQQLLKGGALSADDRTALRAGVEKADALLGRISDVAAKMQYIKSALSRYDINTVKSSDKVNIENILADIQALLDGDNLTSTERIEMESEKAKAEALLGRIQDAYDQAHTSHAQEASKLTEDSVQLSDRATIEGAIKDLNTAIELYPGNYTAVERKEIDDELARLATLLTKLDAIGAVQDMIDQLPSDAQPGDEAAKDAYEAAKDAYEQLGSRDKDKVNTGKLDALGDLLKAYAIVEGHDGVWVKRSKEGLGFVANGSAAALYQILVDNAVVAAGSYTAEAPYTTLTFSAEYLQSLEAGEHTLTVRYGDGEASCNFTVEAKGMSWLWILLLILLVLIASAYLCYSIYSKKENRVKKA